MRRIVITAFVAAAVLGVAGCSGSSSDASNGQASDAPSRTEETKAGPKTAAQIADVMAANLPSVVKHEDLTEDTDTNDLLGRPNGYTSATVLFDKAGDCLNGNGASSEFADGPGVSCGATIEVFATDAKAKARSEYLANFADTGLANEYDTLLGTAFLRVDGAVKPSVAEQYAAQFTAAMK